MKQFILVSCFVAIACAGWIPSLDHHEPQTHDSVPIDTPEVQIARAEHLAAHAEASAHGSLQFEHYGEHTVPELSHDDFSDQSHYDFSTQHLSSEHHIDLQQPEHNSFIHHPIQTHKQYYPPAYETSHHEPVIGHDGKPLDTPEVEEAKAHHFAEVHKALARLHKLKRRDVGQYATTFEKSHEGYVVHQNHAPVYGHHESYSHEIPQIDHNGRPLDTAEVEHAKALHFIAHQEALSRNSLHHHQLQEGPTDASHLYY